MRIFIQLLFPLLLLANATINNSQILNRTTSSIPEQYLKLLQNDYRKVISLNGEWMLSSGESSVKRRVQVPFCYDFNEKVTCSRNFNIELDNYKEWNFILACDGINYQCEIIINGKFIAKHEGGFTGFYELIHESILSENENKIEVSISNELDPSKTLPLKNNVFIPKNYGGIYRDIYLIAVPKLFIKNVNISSEIDINFNADITGLINITASDLSLLQGIKHDEHFLVKTEILDSSGIIRASSDNVPFNISSNSTVQIKTHFTFINPEYWSTDNTKLYTFRVTISIGQKIIDMFNCDYGVYEMTAKSNTLALNKGEFKFKGINYIEEFPGKGLCGNLEEIEFDVKTIKSLGCNAIRLSHRSASPYLILLCNRYGLFILEEIPVTAIPPQILGKDNLASLAENNLSEMIALHKNNPCIFGYGIGNDLDVSNEITKSYLRKLFESGKSADNRFIYYTTRLSAEDICTDVTDFVGLNLYESDVKKLKEFFSEPKTKKINYFISNFGKNINPSNFAGYSDPYSIESQSKFLVDYSKSRKSNSFIGSFFYTFSDWNCDSPSISGLDKQNRYFKTTGLYTFNRDIRTSGNIFRKINFDEDIPNLNIGVYSRESPLIFVIIGLFTFILFIYLINSVRRFRENIWRAFFRPFIFFTDIREQNLISSFYNILLALILSISSGLFFANLFYFWKESKEFDFFLSVFFNSDAAKQIATNIFSNPLSLTLILSGIILLKIFLTSVIIWLYSLTLKFRISFNHSYTVAVWGLLPSLILLVIGMFYIRILFENSDFVLIGLFVAASVYLISIYRIIKGTYIIFDTFFIKAYSWGIVTILVLGGSAWFYLNSTRFLSDYFNLIITFIKN